MPLYENGKYHALFIGDMHPVKLMDGNKVVFEPNVSELSGEGLSVNKTYNDSAFVRINGNTQEIGEGDKSPDNPYELKSVGDDGGFDLVSAGKNLFDAKIEEWEQGGFDGALNNVLLTTRIRTKDVVTVRAYTTYTVSVSAGYEVLANIPANTPFAQKVTFTPKRNFTRFAVKKADNSDILPSEILNVKLQLELGDTATPYTPYRGMSSVNFSHTLRSLPDGTKDYIEIDNVQKRAWYQHILKKDTLSAGTSWTLSDAKPNSAFMSTHISSGYLDGNILTSVEEITEEFEVIYELAVKPAPIELDYNEIKTFYPFTQIYTTSEIQPVLEAKIRTWEV